MPHLAGRRSVLRGQRRATREHHAGKRLPLPGRVPRRFMQVILFCSTAVDLNMMLVTGTAIAWVLMLISALQFQQVLFAIPGTTSNADTASTAQPARCHGAPRLCWPSWAALRHACLWRICSFVGAGRG